MAGEDGLRLYSASVDRDTIIDSIISSNTNINNRRKTSVTALQG